MRKIPKGGNPNPHPPQRFSSTHQPANRGAKKANPMKQATRMRNEMLEDFLGTAHKNVRKALERGDLPTSRWLIDHVRKSQDDTIKAETLSPLIEAVDSFEDITKASQQALLLAIKGDMTLTQLKGVQEALARHSVIKGTIDIASLRAELQAVQNLNKSTTDLGDSHLPAWGRLKKNPVIDIAMDEED